MNCTKRVYSKIGGYIRINNSKPTINDKYKAIGKVNIIEKNGGKIIIDKSATLNSNPDGYHVGMPFDTTLLADKSNAIIKIGSNTRIHGTYIHAWDKIIIGDGVLIAAGTTIVDSNGHSSNPKYACFRRHFSDQPKEIVIDDFVWIGMNCIILKGVRIGKCSIISAGSVLKEDVPPYSIVAGNPAQVIQKIDKKKVLPENYSITKLSSEPGFYEY